MQRYATLLSVLATAASAQTTCTVASNTNDATAAIQSALVACNNGGKVVLSGSYTLGTVLATNNLNNVQIELSGVLTLSNNLAYWDGNAIPLTYQDSYTAWTIGGSNIHIFGGGLYAGNGDAWYKRGTSGVRPIPWTILNAKNVLVENIRQTQSPFWHNFVKASSNVTFNNMNLDSIQSNGSQAQNTDGWDIHTSSNVAITNSKIINGDDCVSLKPNATEVLIENLYCQGSHGISVGSLGQYAGEVDIVQNVLIKNITMVNAENGARIKAWGGSSKADSTSGGGSGFVKNVTFEDFYVQNVQLPIVIDQCYETSASTCVSYPSKIAINDIHYINVQGTGSKSSEVVDMECSQICNGITATGTKLVGTKGTAEFICVNIASTAELDFPCDADGVTTGTTTKTSKTSKISSTKTSSLTTTASSVSTTKTSKTTTVSSIKTSTISSTKTSSTKSTAASITKTTTTKTTTASGSGCTATHYAQCGGIGYTGCTVCASGTTCKYSSDYYSQCL
ncbi:Exopolygalacturonase [Dactylellina cionopaga]|nr:Exopolygalacturonase [Dactylellina cionopaga]